MKKIILMVLLVLGLIACDNNEGPFETRKENGLSVLYSNGKLAKGWVEQTNYDFNTDATVKISEIEYDEGMPTGNFKFYDYNGVLYLKAETKEENGVYKGKIIIGHDQNEVLEGEFSINPNWIVDGKVKVDNKSGIMLRGSEIFMATCINGTISSPQLKATKKDGKYDGAYESYFGNGQLYEKCTYKDGKYDRE
ncbi:MAG: hypothetical protein KGV57_03625 [Fusobacterium sp.]|nr:hypothetical protein [Fusobacterium sp.]